MGKSSLLPQQGGGGTIAITKTNTIGTQIMKIGKLKESKTKEPVASLAGGHAAAGQGE